MNEVATTEVSVRTIENILRTGVADQAEGATVPAEAAPDWPRFAREAADLVPEHLRS
jgi:hypothetical protein